MDQVTKELLASVLQELQVSAKVSERRDLPSKYIAQLKAEIDENSTKSMELSATHTMLSAECSAVDVEIESMDESALLEYSIMCSENEKEEERLLAEVSKGTNTLNDRLISANPDKKVLEVYDLLEQFVASCNVREEAIPGIDETVAIRMTETEKEIGKIVKALANVEENGPIWMKILTAGNRKKFLKSVVQLNKRMKKELVKNKLDVRCLEMEYRKAK